MDESWIKEFVRLVDKNAQIREFAVKMGLSPRDFKAHYANISIYRNILRNLKESREKEIREREIREKENIITEHVDYTPDAKDWDLEDMDE